jgi:molybdate transport system substrate-binding protein
VANSDIKVMSSGGLKAVITELAGAFEHASGNKLATVFAPPTAVKGRIESGEAVDVAVMAAALIDDLVRQGRLRGDSRVTLARSGIGVAVRAGAAKPDIGSVAAFRRALLDAKSIVCTDPAAGGASGIHFQKVIERLGIAKDVMAKARLNSGSYNAEFVARGEAELAIQQISEILPVKGAELVGPLPNEVQLITVFAAAIGTHAEAPAAAEELIAFLASPDAARVIAASGMEPG